MSKHYESNSELQRKLLKGIDILADNVGSTLGPRGRNVILYSEGQSPVITKDGVTVAKFVSLEDPVENVGVQILKQAAEQTNTKAGDGTTTATILARAIYRDALKYIASGASPNEIKKGIDLAVEAVCDDLGEMSKPISSEEDIRDIATISANNDSVIGELVASAVDQAGKDGAITIEEARALETTLDVVEGFRFDSGYISSQFVTDERRGLVRYENPLILVTDEKIETVDELLPVLEQVAREGRPFIIVAENVEGQALAALIMNSVRGTMKVAAIKAPRYGEERRNILKDLAVSVGAAFVTKEAGLSVREVKLKHLGQAKVIETIKSFTTIVDGAGEEEQIDERIEILRDELDRTDDLYECEKIQGRITRLASGIAIIRVGAATEVEMIEKKHRIEDALEAVKSAQSEGVVPGGGVALIRASEVLYERSEIAFENEEQEFGVDVLASAIAEPLRQMAKNSGMSPDVILNEVQALDGNFGINFVDGEAVDMFDSGIIDPTKVTTTALRNAASAAGILLTTNHAIIEL